jgi:hypothetical protein
MKASTPPIEGVIHTISVRSAVTCAPLIVGTRQVDMALPETILIAARPLLIAARVGEPAGTPPMPGAHNNTWQSGALRV